MTRKRQKVIKRLRKRARKAGQYVVNHSGDLDCGMEITGWLRPRVAVARQEYQNLVARLRRVDSDFPKERTP